MGGHWDGQSKTERQKAMTNLHPRYLASHVAKYSPKANTVELFLDYNCKFSAKMFKKVQDDLVPLLEKRGLSEKYNLVFVNVIQPWHGMQSSVLHEVSLAVARVHPAAFWTVSRVLFDHGTNFYDTEVYRKSRAELTAEVLALLRNEAGTAVGASGAEQEDCWRAVEQLLQVAGIDEQGPPRNDGTGVIKDSKYFTRYQRTLGVHVTPSVMVNGVLVPQIESSSEPAAIVDILEKVCNW